MRLWLLAAGAIVLGLLLLAYVASPRIHEGFLTLDPQTALAQRQQLQFEGERRANDLAHIQAPLATKRPDANQVRAAVATSLPVA